MRQFLTTTVMLFEKQLNELQNMNSVAQYFETSNTTLLEFVQRYLPIEKHLSTTFQNDSNNPHAFTNKLDEILSTLKNNHLQYTNLHQSLELMNASIKNITNTELKGMFADLQKHLNSGVDSQNIRTLLENFQDKIENVNNQKLNEFDRKTLDVLTNMQSTINQTLDTHHISYKIDSISENLSTINDHFSNNSSKKGQLAEGLLINVLSDAFPDTEVIDTSATANAGDIQLVKENKPTILIDSKHFASKTVPKRDLDKFYSDIQTQNCSGILCNAFGGIANKQHLEIDIVDKNVIVFIHNHSFDASTFQLAVNIIYGLQEQLRNKNNDSISIDQRLYQNLKIEYNYFLQSFRHHLDIIKTNVNSLSQLSFTLLDNFFKRKAMAFDPSKFTCTLCGTSLSTEKILKAHMKKQHGLTSSTSKLPEQAPSQTQQQPPNYVMSFSDKPKGRPRHNSYPSEDQSNDDSDSNEFSTSS
jgi:hypothetical protein